MSRFFQIHPNNPQKRIIDQVVELIKQGAVVAYPTDSCYALGCHIGDKQALERIRDIRKVDTKHNFTLVCRDLSEIAIYAKVDNSAYRLIKALTPGPYTFILQASREVPRRLMNPKRKTIGLRVPDHAIAQALLVSMNEPLISSTLILPEDELHPMTDPYEIQEKLGKRLDLVIDGGPCGIDSTTVIDFVSGQPIVIRVGKGDPLDLMIQQDNSLNNHII